jgi:hypothetical protein
MDRFDMKSWLGVVVGGALGIAMALGTALADGKAVFSTASLSGSYIYSNSSDDVASLGIINFDGRGGVTLDIRISARQADGRRATVSAQGSGTFSVDVQGIGSAEIAMTKGPAPQLDFDFVIVDTADGVAEHVSALLRSGGVNGQLVQPSWTRRSE